MRSHWGFLTFVTVSGSATLVSAGDYMYCEQLQVIILSQIGLTDCAV